MRHFTVSWITWATFVLISLFTIPALPGGTTLAIAEVGAHTSAAPKNCEGTCVPEATCPTGQTIQHNCGCKGGARNCDCKGSYTCYNSNGVPVSDGDCSGECEYKLVNDPDPVHDMIRELTGVGF